MHSYRPFGSADHPRVFGECRIAGMLGCSPVTSSCTAFVHRLSGAARETIRIVGRVRFVYSQRVVERAQLLVSSGGAPMRVAGVDRVTRAALRTPLLGQGKIWPCC